MDGIDIEANMNSIRIAIAEIEVREATLQMCQSEGGPDSISDIIHMLKKLFFENCALIMFLWT